MKLGFLTIIIGNLASKLLGVIREVLFAAWFGAGEIAAAYRIAQTGFLMPTHTLVGDTISAGVLPLYKKLQSEGTHEHQVLLIIACLYGVVFSAVVTTLVYLYSELVVNLIAPGASAYALELASSLLKIMVLATPFYVLSGVIGYVETAFGKFGAISWRPALINIGAIIGAAIATFSGIANWLAWGLLFSHIFFFLLTVYKFRKLEQIFPETTFLSNHFKAITKQFFKNMLPLLGLPVLAQGNVLIERVVSSWIGTSVIPSLDYARFVSETMVNLIAMPLGILTMSKHGGYDHEESKQHIYDISTLIMVISFPAAIFTALNATDFVTLLFARGKFDQNAVQITSQILFWIGLSLGTTITGYYMVKALNSQLRNSETLLITAAGCVGNALVNLIFWRSLGPACLGIGAATYSVTIFILCTLRLQLATKLLGLIGWIALGSMLNVLVNYAIKDQFHYPVNLLLNTIASLVVWCLVFIISKPFRLATLPVIMRLPDYIKNWLPNSVKQAK